MGVLKWVDWTVSEPRYFQLQTDHTPIHLALLDEVWRHVAASVPFMNDGVRLQTSTLPPPPHRSARATSCCTHRSSSCSSSCLRRSTASWMSWSRFGFCPPPPPSVTRRLTLGWFTCPWQLELKKTLLDRMVHLLSRGYVLPVVGYIRKCLEKLNTDISLIRYFVTEVTSAADARR